MICLSITTLSFPIVAIFFYSFVVINIIIIIFVVVVIAFAILNFSVFRFIPSNSVQNWKTDICFFFFLVNFTRRKKHTPTYGQTSALVLSFWIIQLFSRQPMCISFNFLFFLHFRLNILLVLLLLLLLVSHTIRCVRVESSRVEYLILIQSFFFTL